MTFLGHAGLRIDGVDVSLLIDPWLTTRGAFLGSWHQFPRNDHLDVPGQLDVDWVAVSHEHLDHMDVDVLRRLPERTRVLIPRYPSSVFRDRLTQHGVTRVIELAAWERFPLDRRGSWVTVIPEQSPMCHDSAFLLVVDGHSVLDCNDARLTAAQGRRAVVEVGGRLDVMTVQTSGASWHPLCYGYPADVQQRIEQNKRVSKFRAVQRLVRATAPRLAVPFAGPPCFLDPALAHHNASLQDPGVFPDQEQATAWLSEHLPQQHWDCFRPGDSLELGTGAVRVDPVSATFSYTEGLADYLDRYAADRAEVIAQIRDEHPEPGPELGADIVGHFTRLTSLSPWFLERIGMTLRLDVLGRNGGRWDVRIAPDGPTVQPAEETTHADYTLRLDGRWLAAVLTGRIGWEDLLLSLRFAARRDPDIYNDYLFGLLKHANVPALQAVEQYEAGRDAEETIIVHAADGPRRIGRYCPHAGEDLSEGAVVVGNTLRCLGHNFDFDLRTGQCLNARCVPLAVALPSTADATG